MLGIRFNMWYFLFLQCVCQADLTRGMRKYDFVDPGKKAFLAKQACLSFVRLVRKKECVGLRYKGSRLKK